MTKLQRPRARQVSVGIALFEINCSLFAEVAIVVGRTGHGGMKVKSTARMHMLAGVWVHSKPFDELNMPKHDSIWASPTLCSVRYLDLRRCCACHAIRAYMDTDMRHYNRWCHECMGGFKFNVEIRSTLKNPAEKYLLPWSRNE